MLLLSSSLLSLWVHEHDLLEAAEVHLTIELASDDVTKLSNSWQRGKLVLNKDSAPCKSMLGEKSLTGRSFYSFVERSERF